MSNGTPNNIVASTSTSREPILQRTTAPSGRHDMMRTKYIVVDTTSSDNRRPSINVAMLLAAAVACVVADSDDEPELNDDKLSPTRIDADDVDHAPPFCAPPMSDASSGIGRFDVRSRAMSPGFKLAT